MDQGFPPRRVWDSVSPVIIVTHLYLLPLIALMAFLAFRTMRQPANKEFVKNWGRALVVLVGVGFWILVSQGLSVPGSVEFVFQSYLGIAVLIGIVAIQVCDFRFLKQTHSGFDAFVLSSFGGFGRGIFIVVVAAMLSILPAMLFSNPSGPRAAAPLSHCKNNLKQLWLAMLADSEANDGKWPRSEVGQFPVSWRVRFLPFIDQMPLRKQYDEEHSWDDAKNLAVAQTAARALMCPTNPHEKDAQQRYFTSYVMVTGPGTAAPGDRDIRLYDFQDGISNTAVLVEAAGLNIVWTEPRDADVSKTAIDINLKGRKETDSPGLLSSYHDSGRVNITMADGRVRTINERIDPQVLKSLTTIAGDEPLPSDW